MLCWPSSPWRRRELCSPPACGLGQVGRTALLSPRIFRVEGGDEWPWKKEPLVENVMCFIGVRKRACLEERAGVRRVAV